MKAENLTQHHIDHMINWGIGGTIILTLLTIGSFVLPYTKIAFTPLIKWGMISAFGLTSLVTLGTQFNALSHMHKSEQQMIFTGKAKINELHETKRYINAQFKASGQSYSIQLPKSVVTRAGDKIKIKSKSYMTVQNQTIALNELDKLTYRIDRQLENEDERYSNKPYKKDDFNHHRADTK